MEFNILGFSSATVAMILETLARRFDADLHVKIIQNLSVNDTLPFATDSVDAKTLKHEAWQHERDAREAVPCVCGAYQPETKQTVFRFFADRYGVGLDRYATLAHPAAELAATAALGAGVQIGPGAVLAPYVALGDLVSVNRGAMIGHHTQVGAGATLNPGVQIAGNCEIGAQAAIGIGAVVVDGIRIGEGATIAAGSVVRKDVPDAAMAVGNPARILRPKP